MANGDWWTVNQPVRRRAKAGYLVTDTAVFCELAVAVVTTPYVGML
jgi:hypothetical protein